MTISQSWLANRVLAVVRHPLPMTMRPQRPIGQGKVFHRCGSSGGGNSSGSSSSSSKTQQQVMSLLTRSRHQASIGGDNRRRRRRLQHCAATGGIYSADSVTQQLYEEQQYESTQQAASRKAWQSDVRSATGRKHHVVWEPQLDPPALLGDVAVVLVGPKKPISCGVVARACSCFECGDLRIVAGRCDHNTRSSRSVSKGAQYILWRAQTAEQLAAALTDVDLSVAFTRWLPEREHKSLPDIPSLLQHPTVQQMLRQPPHTIRSSSSSSSSSNGNQQQQEQQQQAESTQQQQQQHPNTKRPRIALVFGREEFGLSDEEVVACDVACAISIGRLQESLSLSHAVSIVLAQFYQARLSCVAAASSSELPYVVRHASQLAEGYDSNSGVEH